MPNQFLTFRLRTLFIFVAVVAVSMIILPPLLDWSMNPPSVPLSRVVTAYNVSNANRDSTKQITEDEIVDAIESQLPMLVEAERIKKTLRRIVHNRRVPPSTTIEQLPASSFIGSGNSGSTTNLNFVTGPESGFTSYTIQISVSPTEE